MKKMRKRKERTSCFSIDEFSLLLLFFLLHHRETSNSPIINIINNIRFLCHRSRNNITSPSPHHTNISHHQTGIYMPCDAGTPPLARSLAKNIPPTSRQLQRSPEIYRLNATDPITTSLVPFGTKTTKCPRFEWMTERSCSQLVSSIDFLMMW